MSWNRFRSSIRTRTSTRTRRRRKRSPTSWVTTTTPSWRTRPACPRRIEGEEIDPKEKVRRLVEWLGPLDNTIQVSWLLEMCRRSSSIFTKSGSRPTTGKRSTTRPKRKWQRRLGAAGSREKPARAGLSHERLRRSAERIRYGPLRPVSSHRRSRVPSRQTGRAAAIGQGDGN